MGILPGITASSSTRMQTSPAHAGATRRQSTLRSAARPEGSLADGHSDHLYHHPARPTAWRTLRCWWVNQRPLKPSSNSHSTTPRSAPGSPFCPTIPPGSAAPSRTRSSSIAAILPTPLPPFLFPFPYTRTCMHTRPLSWHVNVLKMQGNHLMYIHRSVSLTGRRAVVLTR